MPAADIAFVNVNVVTMADDNGMRFAGHVPDAVGVPLALEPGISTIDHLDGCMQQLIPADVDPTGGVGGFFGVSRARIAERVRIPAIVAQTVAAGTWNVPTESLFENIRMLRSCSMCPGFRCIASATTWYFPG